MSCARSRAILLDWSNAGGSSESDRVGCRWNHLEDAYLDKAFREGHSIDRMANVHGRTANGITERLIYLGCVSREELVAGDFLTPHKEVNTDMHMTTNRLRLMLAISQGLLRQTPRSSDCSNDLGMLTAGGLICGTPGSSDSYRLSNAGATVLASVLKTVQLLSSVTYPVSIDAGQRQTGANILTCGTDTLTGRRLGEAKFFMVANGDLMTDGVRKLSNPPRVVHGSKNVADAEATRLASVNRGQRFFVLQAVSVHEAPPNNVRSKAL